MRYATLILVLIVFGCATDDDIHEEEWDDDSDARGASSAAPTHNPELCPGGSGGPEPVAKKPIPAPRDCSQLLDPVECRDCCDWNVEKVWGERCRRMPKRTEEQRRARALCWADAERRRGDCQADCPIEILTLTGAP